MPGDGGDDQIGGDGKGCGGSLWVEENILKSAVTMAIQVYEYSKSH